MVDIDLVLIKAGNVSKHLERVRDKCGHDLVVFQKDRDQQDIVCFNNEARNTKIIHGN